MLYEVKSTSWPNEVVLAISSSSAIVFLKEKPSEDAVPLSSNDAAKKAFSKDWKIKNIALLSQVDGLEHPKKPSKYLENKVDQLYLTKKSVANKIDNKTSALIDKGFIVKETLLSSSSTAQNKWSLLFLSKDSLTYPVLVSAKDNKTVLELTSSAEVEQAYLAMTSHVQGYLTSGALLKKRVADAVSQAELDAIVDDRT